MNIFLFSLSSQGYFGGGSGGSIQGSGYGSTGGGGGGSSFINGCIQDGSAVSSDGSSGTTNVGHAAPPYASSAFGYVAGVGVGGSPGQVTSVGNGGNGLLTIEIVSAPSPIPSMSPSGLPTPVPTTALPTFRPSAAPTLMPSTLIPTQPSMQPTPEPTPPGYILVAVYLGNYQSFTIPLGITSFTVVAVGAGGGNCPNCGSNIAGYGAYIEATFSTASLPSSIVFVFVGGVGVGTVTSSLGGFNSYCSGAPVNFMASGVGTTGSSGGGGGASDIRTSINDVTTRIIVAGGGGGSSSYGGGGNAGIIAQNGKGSGGGGGASPTAGGLASNGGYESCTSNPGTLCDGGNSCVNFNYGGGGGGGGMYGGGGGDNQGGGGGGSSAVNPLMGFIVANITGFQPGNGHVYIKDTSPSPIPTKIPTPSPTPDTFFSCPAYVAVSTDSDRLGWTACGIYACQGSSILVSGCPSSSASAICVGDQYLRLFNASGTQVAFNDNGPASSNCGLCLQLSFNATLPGCQTYSLHEGCSGNGLCGGTITVTGNMSLAPAVQPCPLDSFFYYFNMSCVTCPLGYTAHAAGATSCTAPIIGTPFVASYTGSNQYYTVPINVSVLQVQMWLVHVALGIKLIN